ncbi:hypothetical protein BJ165DRAFT_1504853 [Panaeolus papilionaceus]|nr:hypothetical protein BJ165DRAFT_1504853 [Panaeolus papilionaceus]
MSATEGNLKDLSQGGKESLRALIQAIAPETKDGGGDTLNRLTEKLSELVGAEAEEEFKHQRNERGELVNEEGLPIIEITEPIDNEPRRRLSASLPPPVTVEPLIKLSSLSEVAQARLKEQRNRILDLLEEEEQQLEEQEKKREEQTRREEMQQDAARDKGRAKEARELQKKMGRALLKNISLAQEKEKEEKEIQRLKDEEMDRQKPSSSKKKTVVFADSVHDSSEMGGKDQGEDWGDIIPATLRSSNRPTLLDKQPMKMIVVERVPGGKPANPTAHLFQYRREPDSDDESDPDPINSSDEDGEDEEDQELEADEVDYDYAQHQREIALEYFKKRGSIGQAAAAALKNYAHDDHHPLENPDVLKDSPTPVISQFKANRLAEAYQSSGHKPKTSKAPISFGVPVFPASGARTIQRSIRTGKVDADGNLVGGEADSASENEDEQLQEVLDLIKKGEVLNVGSSNEYLATIPPKSDPWQQTAPVAPSSGQESVEKPLELPAPTVHSKVSKFKVSRAAAGRPNPSISPDLAALSEVQSTSSTPVSHAPRSSPKNVTPIEEKTPEFVYNIHAPKPHLSSALPPQFSMIVESPDFPRPKHVKGSPLPVTPTPVQERKPPGLTTSNATVPSLAAESPSFPSVAGSSSRRPERPPTVLSSRVVESQNHNAHKSQQAGSTETPTVPKKVSKFKQERI